IQLGPVALKLRDDFAYHGQDEGAQRYRIEQQTQARAADWRGIAVQRRRAGRACLAVGVCLHHGLPSDASGGARLVAYRSDGSGGNDKPILASTEAAILRSDAGLATSPQSRSAASTSPIRAPM